MITRAILLSVGIVACASRVARHDTGASAGAERLTLEVGPTRVPCTGEARTQCLRVRVLPDTAWQIFYARIDGFTFEEGFRWRLDVERRRVPNPPADASSLAYRLIRVISKERATTLAMPLGIAALVATVSDATGDRSSSSHPVAVVPLRPRFIPPLPP